MKKLYWVQTEYILIRCCVLWCLNSSALFTQASSVDRYHYEEFTIYSGMSVGEY